MSSNHRVWRLRHLARELSSARHNGVGGGGTCSKRSDERVGGERAVEGDRELQRRLRQNLSSLQLGKSFRDYLACNYFE